MYLLSLEAYVVGIIIAVVAVQYAVALFCLIKLAFLDIPKKQYVLWNLLILLVFFIGDIAFIIYYYKVGKNKKIPPYVPATAQSEGAQENAETENGNAEEAENNKDVNNDENDEKDKKTSEPAEDGSEDSKQ